MFNVSEFLRRNLDRCLSCFPWIWMLSKSVNFRISTATQSTAISPHCALAWPSSVNWPPLKGEVEIDDSYFGAKRVKGKIIFRYGLGYWQYLRLNLSHRIQQLLQCFHLWSEAIDSRLT